MPTVRLRNGRQGEGDNQKPVSVRGKPGNPRLAQVKPWLPNRRGPGAGDDYHSEGPYDTLEAPRNVFSTQFRSHHISNDVIHVLCRSQSRHSLLKC